MIKLSAEKVQLLHKLMAEETGGDPGLRRYRPARKRKTQSFQSFGGEEFYPGKGEKGTRIGYSPISNHAFVDGNKRIGMLAMLLFLEANGVKIDPSNEEFARVGLAVASGKMDYEELLKWVRDNEKK
ncbi:MAG: type II toxin-antitoxin system death-on-curing family toxin [Oscillospiraceae bacterium]|nr:type II toxin-antitoxin system death-on-curing family toxin [Oscillospiraceae bacterium]